MTTSLPLLLTLWGITSIIIIFLICHTTHPLIMVILLLCTTMIMCAFLSFWNTSYIYSMLFALTMISGLLIIFMYFSSLISNEHSKNKLNKLMMMTFLPNILYGILNYNKIHNLYSPSVHSPDLQYLLPQASAEDLLTFIYTPPMLPLTFISIMYLLTILMPIIKICSPKSMPLRKLTN